MFYKEIREQTEPGNVFLKHLEAQIFKISPLCANHGDIIVGLMSALLYPKNSESISV